MTDPGAMRETHGHIEAGSANALADLLGHPADLRAGDRLQPLGHWVQLNPFEPYADRGSDGHARRGTFLPELADLPRRMWAGSTVSFDAPLVIGAAATRRSSVGDVVRKDGRSGPLAFATVRHEIVSAGRTCVTEDQTLVFRPAADGPVPRAATGDAARGVWHREVEPDAVMLFRYSALSANSHRIHYDPDYARDVEHYAGLVVHGPLAATLLMDLALRNAPDASVRRFSFTARAPILLGDIVSLDGGPDGRLRASRDGVPCIEAEVAFA